MTHNVQESESSIEASGGLLYLAALFYCQGFEACLVYEGTSGSQHHSKIWLVDIGFKLVPLY